MAGKKRAEDMSLEDLEDGFEEAELAEIYDEPVDEGDDSDLIQGWLFLTREGFEDYELNLEKPYIDFADFGDYVADEITEDLFGWVKNETLLDGVADEIKGQALDFANGSILQAMTGIGGFGWFESIDLNYSYSPKAGTLSISLESLLKSPVDHGVMNKTEYAPLEKEAKKTASEGEIEIDKDDVKMHADVDDGEGDLQEWIYDALEERLRLDGREDEIGGLDAVAKDVADECGNSLDGFKGSLKLELSDDGEGIKSFEYDGKTHGLDEEAEACVK